MAGRPKTRARLEAAAAAADHALTEAVPLETPSQRTRAHAYARPVRHATAAPAGPGKPTWQARAHNAADAAAARAVEAVSEQLNVGMQVDIERVAPPWCSGSLELYDIDSDVSSIAELKEYIREEYGGKRYRLHVQLQGRTLWTTFIKLAGPPMDGGRRITRDDWDPVARVPVVAVAPPPSAAQPSGENALLLKMFEFVQNSGNNTLSAVKDMITNQGKQTQDLIGQIVTQRSDATRAQSFKEQLSEFAEASAAIDNVREQLRPDAPPPTAAATGDDDDGVLGPALKEAKQEFARRFVGSLFDGKNAPSAKKGQQPRPGAAAAAKQRRQQPPPPQRQQPQRPPPQAVGMAEEMH